ncbi:hypothetical protein [Spongiactinospora sp. 9N601]|uniref:hypothetical protein n=1 Tax=Spongiactinospora sp. 9N601 TaxID=3375149 RepID=UPI00379987AF
MAMETTAEATASEPAVPQDPPPPWELWVRCRGPEVVAMMRVGGKVSELTMSGEGDVLGALGKVLAALGR